MTSSRHARAKGILVLGLDSYCAVTQTNAVLAGFGWIVLRVLGRCN